MEASGLARARWKGSALAHNRSTPSGDPVMVYLCRVGVQAKDNIHLHVLGKCALT